MKIDRNYQNIGENRQKNGGKTHQKKILKIG